MSRARGLIKGLASVNSEVPRQRTLSEETVLDTLHGVS